MDFPAAMRRRLRTTLHAAGCVAVVGVLTTSCVSFDEPMSSPFSRVPEGGPATTTTTPRPPQVSKSKEAGPCRDPDGAVIATCLTDPTTVIGTESLKHTYVSERISGQVLYTTTDAANSVVVTIPGVDSSGDGGLVSIALSPFYGQDRLIYALVTTATDNRVVRIAPGDVVKPILTGIPKGATGNVGSISFVGPDQLIVATGNTGDERAATDAASLAGKVLLLNDIRSNTPTPPEVLFGGLGSRVSICAGGAGGSLLIAQQKASGDVLSALPSSPRSGGTLSTVWTWPNRPGLDGCAATEKGVFVSAGKSQEIVWVPLESGGTTASGEPGQVVNNRYGTPGRMDFDFDGVPIAVSRNKIGGRPVATDDRAFIVDGPTSPQQADDSV